MQNSFENLLSKISVLSSEWGQEAIVICVPRAWEQFKDHLPQQELAMMRFITESSIRVNVVVDDVTVWSYMVESDRVTQDYAASENIAWSTAA